MKFIDLTGKRFGRLTVLRRAENSPGGRVQWLCECDCGSRVRVSSTHLRTGHTQSCGCFKIERTVESAKHGGNRRGKREALYDVWIDMRRRCYNPKDQSFPYYGGRGITVCSAWLESYSEFRDWALSSGYQAGLTLDRKDTDGNYAPENCRWATRKEQNFNKRNNHRLEFGGRNLTLAEWEAVTGLPQRLIRCRVVELGWPIEKALTEPVRGR